jgi:hypothetical protein
MALRAVRIEDVGDTIRVRRRGVTRGAGIVGGDGRALLGRRRALPGAPAGKERGDRDDQGGQAGYPAPHGPHLPRDSNVMPVFTERL